MAATILVRDALYRVSVQLVDVNPQFIRWTERELVHWLNDAQRAIAKYLPAAFSKVDTIKLVQGSRQSIESILAANIKPGDGGVAADTRGRMLLDVHRNMGDDGLTPGVSIRLVPREHLDLNNTSWRSTTGSPISLYTFDPRTPKVFYVFPAVPAAPAAWVEIAHLIEPRDIAVPTVGQTLYGMDGNSATTLSVDDMYIDDLVNYVLARAHLKDAESAGNSQLAGAHTQMFVSSINAQATALTGVNPNLQSLPLAPTPAAAAK